jgi:GNAT superfamily N-acetyltransferase
MKVEVRPACGALLRVCRMLLGDAASTHPDYHLFIAVSEAHQPLGAGSLRSGIEEIGELWSVHLHALPEFRNDGIDRKLLGYAQSHAASHGAKQIQTMHWFAPGSAAERYWLSLGFTPHDTRCAHEIDVDRSFAKMSPLCQELRDRGWIPPEAKTIPLAEADLDRVCELHLRYLGGHVRHLLPLVDGSAPNAFDRQASVVLLLGSRTIGFTLGWFPEPSVCEISANVLEPAVRLGWANVLLKYEALRRVMARNARIFRFFTMDRHTDSRRALTWAGGTTRTEVRLRCSC